jgi:hypothetical protein
MKTHTHTPGPWSIAFYGETERPVIKHGNQSIADVRGCELDDSTSHSMANARLIAAAPELLQVTRDFLLLAALHDWEGAAIDFAKATLAKAEGVK